MQNKFRQGNYYLELANFTNNFVNLSYPQYYSICKKIK